MAAEVKIAGAEIDTSGMSERSFEIFLKDLGRGSKTVSMEQLRAVQNEGPYEELAPPPFLEAKPLIY